MTVQELYSELGIRMSMVPETAEYKIRASIDDGQVTCDLELTDLSFFVSNRLDGTDGELLIEVPS